MEILMSRRKMKLLDRTTVSMMLLFMFLMFYFNYSAELSLIFSSSKLYTVQVINFSYKPHRRWESQKKTLYQE